MQHIRPSVGVLFASVIVASGIHGCSCDGSPQHEFSIWAGYGGASSTNVGGNGGDSTSSTGSGGGGANDCSVLPPDKDNDGDGYTEIDGDCHDCDPKINPGAIEVPTRPDDMGNYPQPMDENCNGVIDEAPPICDTDLLLDSKEPLDAAKAIGLCDFVKSAKWVLADGTPISTDAAKLTAFHLGHGILSRFGTNNNPLEGARMLMLSSGTARNKEDGESIYRSFDKNYTSNGPFGFPKLSPMCPSVKSGVPHDSTGLEIELDVPTNATAASFDFQFFSYAWPDYVCTEFSDYFVAFVEPFPMGQTDGNIAFDGNMNPVGVNFGGMLACSCPDSPLNPCSAGGIAFECKLGTDPLAGTPFESDLANPGWTHGSTGWLRSMMPVTPGGNIRIRFVTYDSGDGNLDSSTLIDNWQWYDNFVPIPKTPLPEP